ncbi:hypothetical protein SBOR_2381 [Sclerotinia borealis F-4128]|uniref:Uncharacterized protein n=1 Tax=Sclerotinia borealis (strain F-4128) TaxID=1432307 RepID=W9CMK8_SCLBF|nr:hypothetical protein SBOR_2381 [Sclerotinia borealis F-4128]
MSSQEVATTRYRTDSFWSDCVPGNGDLTDYSEVSDDDDDVVGRRGTLYNGYWDSGREVSFTSRGRILLRTEEEEKGETEGEERGDEEEDNHQADQEKLECFDHEIPNLSRGTIDEDGHQAAQENVKMFDQEMPFPPRNIILEGDELLHNLPDFDQEELFGVYDKAFFSTDTPGDEDDYKNVSDWSDDDVMPENARWISNMENMKQDIDEYACLGLADLLWEYVKLVDVDVLTLPRYLLEHTENSQPDKRYGKVIDAPLSKFRNNIHHLLALTSTGVTRNLMTGLYELVYLAAKGDLIEGEVLKYLDPQTLSLYEYTTPRTEKYAYESEACLRVVNIRPSKTYVFVAALKFFMLKFVVSSEGLTPDTFCTLNRILSSADEERITKENDYWYFDVSKRYQCKTGIHDWLTYFIFHINTQDHMRIDSKFNPIYEISLLYLRFIAGNRFGKQTRHMSMILLQSLALKWLHYMVLPFDENEKEFQYIMTIPSMMAVPKLAGFLENVLARNIDKTISRSRGVTSSREDLNNISDTEVNKLQTAVDFSCRNDALSSLDFKEGSFDTGLVLEGVSLKLNSILALSGGLRSKNGLNEEDLASITTSPGFQFGISGLNRSGRSPLGDKNPPSIRRNSCTKCSPHELLVDKCIICHGKPVKDWSDGPRVASRVVNRSNAIEIPFKLWSRGPSPEKTKTQPESNHHCPIYGTIGNINQCFNCGPGITPSVSDEGSEWSKSSREPSPSPEKKDLPPAKKEPPPKTYNCPNCGAMDFLGVCHICSYGSPGLSEAKPTTLKKRSPTSDWNKDEEQEVEFQAPRYSPQARYRFAHIRSQKDMVVRNRRYPATQQHRHLAFLRALSSHPQTAGGVPDVTFDGFQRIAEAPSGPFSLSEVTGDGSYDAIERDWETNRARSLEAAMRRHAQIRLSNHEPALSVEQDELCSTTDKEFEGDEEDNNDPYSSSSQEEIPPLDYQNHPCLVEKCETRNMQTLWDDFMTRNIDGGVVDEEKGIESPLAQMSLLERGKRCFSGSPWTFTMSTSSLLGLRMGWCVRGQKMRDEEAVEWVDED